MLRLQISVYHLLSVPDHKICLLYTSPSFGTTEELKELVQKAHECGMKVVMDAVFNHTGRDFFAFKDIIEKEEIGRAHV